jgi:hypothetical protein
MTNNHETTGEPGRIDYDAARKRLLAISADPAVRQRPIRRL